MRALLALTGGLLVVGPVWAAKVPQDVRAAFEERFFPKRTYLVVMQRGIPTTSIYGVDGSQSEAYYSIDVTGESGWKTSTGLLDLDQRAADVLGVGEVLELVQVSFKDNRIDLRAISLEAHKVTRGGLLSSTKREPVSTNFKFFLPVPKSKTLTRDDLPEAFRLVEAYVKPFPNELAARAFVAQAAASSPQASAGVSKPGGVGPAPPSPAAKKEIKAGMTPLQVIEVLGKPVSEVSFESRTRWSYADLTIVFESGRVKEVKF